MHHRTAARRRRRGALIIATAMAAAAAVAGGVAARLPASAADVYTTNASIDELHFTSETVTSGSSAELSGTWSLPDDPATPAGFVIDLPEALQGRSDGFPLLAPDGSAMGRCTVSATQLDCAIASDYIAAHPNDLHGSFSFWVTVQTQTDAATSTTYEVGGQAVTISVEPASSTPGTGVCTVGCDFTGRTSGKWGNYDAANGVIEWTVVVGSGTDGMTGGQRVSVTDRPGGNQELITSFRDYQLPTLWQTNQKNTGADGREGLTGWASAPRDTYTSTAGTVAFTTQQGYFYDVHFATKVTDGGLAGTYTNQATITIDGGGTAPVTSTVVHQGGGGNGSGTEPVSTPTPTPTPTVTPTRTPEPSQPPVPTETPAPSITPKPSAPATPPASTAPTGSPTPSAAPIGAAVETGGTVVDDGLPWPSIALVGAGGLTLLILLGGWMSQARRARR